MSKILKGAAIAAAIIFTGGLAGVAFGLSGATLAAFYAGVNALAFSTFVNGVLSQMAGSPNAPRPSLNVEYSGTVELRAIIYGELDVSGMNVIPPLTTGTNNKFLHQVLAIAGHEVSAMTTVRFNQEALGTITTVAGNANDGKVTTGTFANKAWVRRYLGTATQTADYILDTALAVWTSSHRGRGIAYLAIQYEYDPKVYKQGGKPEVVVHVEGKKVYDPRKDSTNGGSGAHRHATPSTWEFSSNPALCLADYLTDLVLGVKMPATRIDWPMVAAAADECDELVAIPTATTQKRYTCNIRIFPRPDWEENCKLLAAAMLGTCIYSGGKWRMAAGSWSSAAFTLDDDNYVGQGAELTTAYPFNQRFNGIRGTFIDPANNYQPNEFPAVQNPTYVTADNGESIFKDTRFEACTNVHESQRNAIYLTRKSRNKEASTLYCDFSAFKIRPGETGIVTNAELGWSNKTVRCEGWKFNPSGYVELAVREELASDWNDPIEADYKTPLAISNPTPVYFTPDPVTALSALGGAWSIMFTWSPPALVPSGAIYDLYEYTAITPFSSAAVIWSGTSTSVTIQKTDNVARYYWIVLRMPNGTESSHYPATNGVLGQVNAAIGAPVALIGVGLTVLGDVATKVGGASAYDSDVHSLQGFKNGAYVSFRPVDNTHDLLVGMSTTPASDQNYTSLDYALNVKANGTLVAYEGGSLVASFSTYAAGDDLSITYDGAIVRYLQNGTVLRETVAPPNLLLYLDSSFYTPGGSATNLRFGPYGTAAPYLYNARGNAKVGNSNAEKVGGSAAYDSDVYSLRGYGICHVSFKANSNTRDLVLGLSTAPLSNLSYTSINFGWYAGSAGAAHIYEGGTDLGSFGAYDETTVFAITYDAATVTYWKNGVSVRTVSASALTLYLDSSFYQDGAGVNSLRFGPTTNLAVSDTSQLGPDAATKVYTDALASDAYNVTWGSSGQTDDGDGLDIAVENGAFVEITVSADVEVTTYSTPVDLTFAFAIGGYSAVIGSQNPKFPIRSVGKFAVTLSVSVTGSDSSGGLVFNYPSLPPGSGNVLTVTKHTMRATAIRR